MNSNQHPNQGITERAQADKRNAATMETSKVSVTRNPVAEPSKLTVTTTINKSNGGLIAETLAIKDRSKNGSEPIGGLSKGHLKIQDSKENNDPTST